MANVRHYDKPAVHRRPLKGIEQRFEAYAYAIADDPFSLSGRWREVFEGRLGLAAGSLEKAELVVDLGCGKGRSAVEAASADPRAPIVGVDYEETCIALAAKLACTCGRELGNLLFAQASADEICELFAPGEASAIRLSYPTPFPKKKHARLRLTDASRLVLYRRVLCDGGRVELKTDSQPLFDYTLLQLDLAGYDVEWMTRDLFGGRPAESTEYEELLTRRGARVHALRAVPAREPSGRPFEGELSLVAYLPEDLESMGYVPFGMEEAVENMRNRARKVRERERG